MLAARRLGGTSGHSMGTYGHAELEAPRLAPPGSERLTALVCRARDRLCALPVAQVVETMRPLPLQPLGAMPPFVKGLAAIRGAAVPVVDLGLLLGAAAPAAPARFVTVRAGARLVALAVEEIAGVRVLAGGDLAALPPLLRDASDGAAAALGRLDAELLYVLELSRAVPDDVWRALAAAGGEARG